MRIINKYYRIEIVIIKGDGGINIKGDGAVASLIPLIFFIVHRLSSSP